MRARRLTPLALVAVLALSVGAGTALGQIGLGGPDAPPAPDPAPSAPAPRPSTPAPSGPSRAPNPPAAQQPSGPTPAELAAQRRAEREQQARQAELRRQERERAKQALIAKRKAEVERARLAAIERRQEVERQRRQEAAVAASRALEANRGAGQAIAADDSSGGGRWRALAIALLVVAAVTGALSLFPTAARRYDIQANRGMALLTRHRLELGTLCVGTLATLALVQLLT